MRGARGEGCTGWPPFARSLPPVKRGCRSVKVMRGVAGGGARVNGTIPAHRARAHATLVDPVGAVDIWDRNFVAAGMRKIDRAKRDFRVLPSRAAFMPTMIGGFFSQAVRGRRDEPFDDLTI